MSGVYLATNGGAGRLAYVADPATTDLNVALAPSPRLIASTVGETHLPLHLVNSPLQLPTVASVNLAPSTNGGTTIVLPTTVPLVAPTNATIAGPATAPVVGSTSTGGGAFLSISQSRPDKNGPARATLVVKPANSPEGIEATSEKKAEAVAAAAAPASDAVAVIATPTQGALAAPAACGPLSGPMQTAHVALPGLPRTAFMRDVTVVTSVFLFFLMVQLLMLVRTEQTINFMLSVRMNNNEQLLSVACSLTEQLLSKAAIADELLPPYKHTPPVELERVLAEVEQLRALRNHSITALHRGLSYLGSEDDLRFLIEEHVAYEEQVKKLATEELRWLQITGDAQRIRLGQRQVYYASPSGQLLAAQHVQHQTSTRTHSFHGVDYLDRATDRAATLARHVRRVTVKDATRPRVPTAASRLDPTVEAYVENLERGTLAYADTDQVRAFRQRLHILGRFCRNRFVLVLLVAVLLYAFFHLG